MLFRFHKLQIQAAKKLAAQHLVSYHIFDNVGHRETIDTLLRKYPERWSPSLSNELGRLSQGIGQVKGNNAMTFIPHRLVPKNKKVAYANMVCDHRPDKEEKFRVCLTVGGDVLEYYGDASSPAASLLESKLLINGVISDAHHGARFLTLDIKDYFLQSILEDPEYIRIHYKYFLPDVKHKYNIATLVHIDGFVYCKLQKGMYGLKQAARLARDQLIKNLAPFGYKPDPTSPNIWVHTSRPTKFCLCVDDFGVKYYSEEDIQHLTHALQQHYTITIDRTGQKFCGLNIAWNYKDGFVDVSMPQYVHKALKKLQHPLPTKAQHAPHPWQPITYGKTAHLTNPDTSPLLPSSTIPHIQRIVGTFLYYACAVDPTIHPAVNELAITQSKTTIKTQSSANMLLDYLVTHPTSTLRFYKSDMQLHIDTDAAYLVAPASKSRVTDYYYLSQHYQQIPPLPTPPLNAPVHVEFHLLKHVVSSAAEAETAGIFHNCQLAIPIKNMLKALGHKQHAIPVNSDNSTAVAFSNSMLKEKRSKYWEMRLKYDCTNI